MPCCFLERIFGVLGVDSAEAEDQGEGGARGGRYGWLYFYQVDLCSKFEVCPYEVV